MADAGRVRRGCRGAAVPQSARPASRFRTTHVLDLGFNMVRRREILKTAMALAAAQLPYADLAHSAAPQTPVPQSGPQSAAAGSGPAKPFDYAWLKGQARYLAGSLYLPSKDVLPPTMGGLSYDQYQSLRFRTDHSLWGSAGLPFRL